MVDSKTVWFDYPGCDGFSVELAHLSRKELINLRKNCTITKMDRKTRKPEEVVDEEKFIKEFTRSTVKGWKGFKLKYVEQLVAIDIGSNDPEAELPFSPDQAEVLVENSTEFDNWINEVVFDLDNFRTGTVRTTVETV